MKICQYLLIVSFATVAGVSGVSATKHTIVSSGFTFSPSSLSITLGDTVEFDLTSIHNAVEVSEATWNINGSTPLAGGFALGSGGGIVVLTTEGVHWYVCQPHSGSGMKGTITVSAAPPPEPASILISSLADQDGDHATSADRVGKAWSLKLYQDSVGSGVVVDSVLSGTSLFVSDLTAGTYVAVEADSAYWRHVSQVVDGVPQGPTSATFRSVTVAAGGFRTVDFINTVPNMIISDGFTFVPDVMEVDSADTVRFVLDTVHNAREVSQASWDTDDTTSNGGFDLPLSGGSVVLNDLGTFYYVCVPHAALAMKGIIVVNPHGDFSGPVADVWNLLSLPLKVSDSLVGTLYPSAATPAYTYQGGYLPRTSVTTGEGYWIKFNGPNTVDINGTQFTLDTVDVVAGWNILGSLSVPVEAAAITSIPGGLSTSSFYGYDDGYYTADTIQPGQGYWVKSGGPGSLILSGSASASPVAGRIRIEPGSELPPPAPGSGDALAAVPANFALGVNYPNPFNPATVISFSLPEAVAVRLKVFDLLGREVSTLVSGFLPAGDHQVRWDAGEEAGGVYYYRLEAGRFTQTRVMLLVR